MLPTAFQVGPFTSADASVTLDPKASMMANNSRDVVHVYFPRLVKGSNRRVAGIAYCLRSQAFHMGISR